MLLNSSGIILISSLTFILLQLLVFIRKKYQKSVYFTLKQADGKRFSLDYYMYLAWVGIQNAGYELNLLDDPWISQFKEKHDILMSSSKTFCK